MDGFREEHVVAVRLRLHVIEVFAAVALMAGCGGGQRTVAAKPVPGGCGTTKLYRGPAPARTAQSNPPTDSALPYAVAADGIAIGFLFRYPLLAGHPTNPRNKILWIVRTPGSGLVVRATPLHAAAHAVTITLPDNTGAEIYPSYVDVPAAGCWHITLHWAGRTTRSTSPIGDSWRPAPSGSSHVSWQDLTASDRLRSRLGPTRTSSDGGHERQPPAAVRRFAEGWSAGADTWSGHRAQFRTIARRVRCTSDGVGRV